MLVPIYNIIVLLEIIKKPIWWILLMFIPFVNIIIQIIIGIELGKVFGKSAAWSFILIALLPYFGYPMLAFGSAEYVLDAVAANDVKDQSQIKVTSNGAFSDAMPPKTRPKQQNVEQSVNIQNKDVSDDSSQN